MNLALQYTPTVKPFPGKLEESKKEIDTESLIDFTISSISTLNSSASDSSLSSMNIWNFNYNVYFINLNKVFPEIKL